MPRKNKTNRQIGRFSEDQMRQAIELVQGGTSIRQAARMKGLSFQTVHRYVKKIHQDENVRLCPNYKVKQIFTVEQENALSEYIINCSKMFYGLSRDDTRRLSYEAAVYNNIVVPANWHASKSASLAWIKGFQKRHSELSLRTPEGCSLSRATSFNRFNVDIFFTKLETVLKRFPVFGDGSRIYNLDETGTVTVQKSQKVFAQRGIRQVSKTTSAERGTLVTTCCIVGASGAAIPPAMVFPRVHFKDFMINGAPNGTLGLASKTGWMNTECFVQVVKHFIKHTGSTKENPSLLLMDNHQSHLSIEAIDLCKNNGVTILTIPPHCTNKLQPLDVGLLKPFQTFYNAAVDAWMMNHPGQTFTIYNVAACVGIAYPRAMTPINIASAFRKTGIFPFDRHIFTEEDFLSSSVTDRPLIADEATPENTDEPPVVENAGPSNSDTATKTFVSPSVFKGYPKAPPRKSGESNKKRKGKTMIATDTPEKMELIKSREKTPKEKKVKKRVLDSDSDEQDENEMELQDSSGGEDYIGEDPEPPISFEYLDRCPNIGEYVLVEFNSKQKTYYVGKVLSQIKENDFEISFLRKSIKCENRFLFPMVPDISHVLKKDIKMILPAPLTQGLTKRQKSLLKFEINFDSLNLK